MAKEKWMRDSQKTVRTNLRGRSKVVPKDHEALTEAMVVAEIENENRHEARDQYYTYLEAIIAAHHREVTILTHAAMEGSITPAEAETRIALLKIKINAYEDCLGVYDELCTIDATLQIGLN